MGLLKNTVLACMCAFALTAMEGIVKYDFKSCSVTCIQDTATRMPARLFSDAGNSGFVQKAKDYEASVNVFLLQKDGKHYLVDAGNDQSRGSLKHKLDAMNFNADRISGIFITHIHPDHVGGLLWNGKPLFANATVFIAKEEYDAWLKDAKRAYLAKYLEPYKAKMSLFQYGRELPGTVLPVKKAGHTPGHTVFRFQLGEGKAAYFAGDILHAAELQVPHPTFCASFDMNPTEAVASRQEILKSGMTIFGAHFPFPGIFNK